MTVIKIDLVAGARPNFMKVAPLYRALANERGWCRVRLVHTGQHYDASMSDAFFHDLALPQPDVSLGVGSGTHGEQTAGILVAYERICVQDRPDWVVVVGDVNSTVACSLAATKLGIRVAHLEAGLRSGDRTMPEEINRILTDDIADLLWTPSPDANENLLREGIEPQKIALVGNIMIDSLEMMRASIEARQYFRECGLTEGGYGVVTLHRPSNVDDPETLAAAARMLASVAQKLPLVFPVHPRTRKALQGARLEFEMNGRDGLRLIEPVGYVDFMSLLWSSRLAITDSGGIQEETTYLGIPCMTLRENTERPITVTQGTNRLLKPEQVPEAVQRILRGDWPQGQVPALWDGRTAGRIVASLKQRSSRA